MARLFTMFADGHVKEGICVDGGRGAPAIDIGDCPIPVVVTQSLLAQYKTAVEQRPLCVFRAALKLSGGNFELQPEIRKIIEPEPKTEHALVLLDPRCWWHSQNKVNSGITEIYYHVNPKNLILSGRKHFGAEGLTHCQTLLVHLNVGDEVLIGCKKTEGQGGSLKITRETRALIYTGKTFEDVPVVVQHWRREVA